MKSWLHNFLFFFDTLFPLEQLDILCGQSTVDQVVLLTQNIKDCFEAKKKAGAVFVDLTAAYDTAKTFSG